MRENKRNFFNYNAFIQKNMAPRMKDDCNNMFTFVIKHFAHFSQLLMHWMLMFYCVSLHEYF